MADKPTVKCPNCEGDIEELATGFYHCPSCGAIFGDDVDGKAGYSPIEDGSTGAYDISGLAKKALRNRKQLLIILIIAVVGVAVGIISLYSSSVPESDEVTPEPRVAEERIEVNEPYAVITPKGVTLYAEPDLWSKQLTVAPEGETVTVKEKREYWWLVVRADSSTGWILYRFEDFSEVGPDAGEGTE